MVEQSGQDSKGSGKKVAEARTRLTTPLSRQATTWNSVLTHQLQPLLRTLSALRRFLSEPDLARRLTSSLLYRFRRNYRRVAAEIESLAAQRSTRPLDREHAVRVIAEMERKPLISVIVPVYRVDPRWLAKCIDSVTSQYYEAWELVLVDDCSRITEISDLLHSRQRSDVRIKVIELPENVGIAQATNAGIQASSGEFVAFLDHDDELTPDALMWNAWAHNQQPDARWFYSDEDKLTAFGLRRCPHFKPDFSLGLLLSVMFTCHLSVYEARSIRKVGGLRQGFEGSQDHDLALRLSEVIPPEQIVHIPRILYHWREIPGSMSASAAAKPDAGLAGLRAVKESLARRSIRGSVRPQDFHPCFYELELEPSKYPTVTIVIPTKNSVELVRQCVDSIRTHTRYPNYQLAVIDNLSDCPRLREWLDQESRHSGLTVFPYTRQFNHSEMHNLFVESNHSDFVVFMNNDVEVTSGGWLEQMVASTELDPSIAGVGALLRYPNGTVQHGGLVIGISNQAGHAHRHEPVEAPGYFGRLHCLQEMSGVTAALSLIRRSAFLHVGGFRPDRYPTSFNDVDLWMRLRQAGYRCIYNPNVQAIHYESKTRGRDANEALYLRRFQEDWGTQLLSDPFHNPNLSLSNEQFRGYRHYPPELLLSSQDSESCRKAA